MHPEEEQNQPGVCARCGMSLEKTSYPVSSQVEYTCPMHPEIIQSEPGACPKCGMALEPREVSHDGENPEYSSMKKRFWMGLLLVIPVVFLAMSDMLPGQPVREFVSPQINGWVQLIFSMPVVLWAGLPFFERGWQSVRTGNLNMFTLIALGVGAGFIFSVLGLVVPDLFPPEFKNQDGLVDLYFESSVVIIELVLLGQVLELGAHKKTSQAIRSLLDSCL